MCKNKSNYEQMLEEKKKQWVINLEKVREKEQCCDDYTKRLKIIEKENAYFEKPRFSFKKLRVLCPSCGGNLDSEKRYNASCSNSILEVFLLAICGTKCENCGDGYYAIRDKQHNIRIFWNRTQIITCSQCGYAKVIYERYTDTLD